MTMLNIYRAYCNHKYEKSWCDSMCLQSRILQRAKEIRGNFYRLLLRLKDEGEVLVSCQEDSACIRRCLIAGYF